MHIPLQFVPIAYRLKRLYFGRASLKSATYRSEILCPAEIEEQPLAVFLPGQLDRISGTPTETTLAAEIHSAISATIRHDPTIAYHFRNATLVDGSIYVGNYRYHITDSSLATGIDRQSEHIEAAGLASTFIGSKYFSHWLNDDCIAYMLAEQYGEPLCVRSPPSPHGELYVNFFGQKQKATRRALVNHLVVFQDYAQNSLKRKRYNVLRERVRKHFPGNGKDEFIYLRRGATGVQRVIKNEDEVLGVLVKRGFNILDVATASLEHLLSTLANAKIIVSIEGSHLAHFTYSAPDKCGIIALEPPDRFETVHRDWSGATGRRFGFVVGTTGTGGYSFSPSEILLTIDLMLTSMAS